MAFSIYDFSKLTQSIHDGLSARLSTTGTLAVEWMIVGIVILLFVAVFGLFLVYAERKVCAVFQQRLGPMRVGPWGLVQTIADFIKLLMKELILPSRADKMPINSCTTWPRSS